jgi:hypothetical protein
LFYHSQKARFHLRWTRCREQRTRPWRRCANLVAVGIVASD